MPPKAKFTKKEIEEAAFEIVKEQGTVGLTARSLGAKLESSARPIFTVFQSMDEVQQQVVRLSKALYGKYIERGLSEVPAFKGVGKQYILFAINEPKIFQLLFMKEQDKIPSLLTVLSMIDENYEQILRSIIDGYGFDEPTAKRLYSHLWIYTHGIATLCATKMCEFSSEEISEMITEVFSSIIIKIKSGENK